MTPDEMQMAYRLNRLWDVADTLIGEGEAAEAHRMKLRNHVRTAGATYSVTLTAAEVEIVHSALEHWAEHAREDGELDRSDHCEALAWRFRESRG